MNLAFGKPITPPEFLDCEVAMTGGTMSSTENCGISLRCPIERA